MCSWRKSTKGYNVSIYCWQCLSIFSVREIYQFLLRKVAPLRTIKLSMLHKCYGENLFIFAAQPLNCHLILGLGNLQVEIKKYENTVLLGGSWVSVSTSTKDVFCLLSSIGTSLISVSQEGTGVCRWVVGLMWTLKLASKHMMNFWQLQH